MKIKIEKYWNECYWPNFLDHVQSKFQETGEDWDAVSIKHLWDFINQQLLEYRGKVTDFGPMKSKLIFEDSAGYFEFQLEWS